MFKDNQRLMEIYTRSRASFLMIYLMLAAMIDATGQDQIQFKPYLTESNLSIDHISSIIQDRQGWLWAASRGTGLKRYDGRQFISYKQNPNDPHSLISNDINSIYEDRKGDIWIATRREGLDRYDKDTDQFFHFQHQADDSSSISSNTLSVVLEDEQGGLWIGTDKGLNRLDRSTGRFKHFRHNPKDLNSLSSDLVLSIVEGQKGSLWIGAYGGGLNKFNPDTGKFIRFQNKLSNSNIKPPKDITYLQKDQNGKIWIGTLNNGLYSFDPTVQQFEHFSLDFDNRVPRNIRYIFEDDQGILWLCTRRGLIRFEPQTSRYYVYLPDPKNPFTSNNNDVYTIFQDQEGQYWMGTDDGGLYSFNWRETEHQYYQYDSTRQFSLSNNTINDVYKDAKNNYWIGTDNGLNRFNPNTQGFEVYYPNDGNSKRTRGKRTNQIWRIFEDSKHNLWVSTSAGLKRFDVDKKQFIHYDDLSKYPTSIGAKAVYCLFEDRSGRLWVGTDSDGLYLYEPTVDAFIPYWRDDKRSRLFNTIGSIFENQNGLLWIATWDGLLLFDPQTKETDILHRDSGTLRSISDNLATKVYEDSRGRMWFGTENGLNLLEVENGNYYFKHFFEKDGLAGSDVWDIKEDHQGNLWISSYKGYTVYQPKTGVFRNYFNLGDIELEGRKAPFFQDPETQKMWLGTQKGLFIIHPDSLPLNTYQPPVVISRLSTYQKQGETSDFQEIKAIWRKKAITLPYRQNTISAEFSVLSYKNPIENQIMYQLVGANRDWVNLSAERTAIFNNLSPGRYSLKVKGCNNDGIWNEEGVVLSLRIRPPWYLSIWAKIAYILLAFSVFYAFYRYQIKRKLTLAENRRLQEIDALKNKFFTNITHEFRTPLTIIQGIADQEIDLEGDILKKQNLENAHTIKRNSAQLLHLANQMLKLRKLETGAMSIQMVQDNVLHYLRYLIESFQSYAESKGLQLHYLSDQETLIMDYDPDKLLYIVSNLLSNAIKFTPPGGHIYCSAGAVGDALQLQIKDTGQGIEASKIPHIFNRFYQADVGTIRREEGVGVGLALCQELIKLLNGKISVKSQLGSGATFTVLLPIRREAKKETVQTIGLKDKIIGFTLPRTFQDETSNDVLKEESRPVALIIEDNPDLIKYLSSCLSDEYKVISALDGQIGVEMALELIPDVIISDVVMPQKSGYEVCTILKNDERTSHIPIILLTARADQKSKLTGLHKGADAYLIKPFHQEELQVRLKQLIELRKKLQQRYAELQLEEATSSESIIEDEFLRKVRRAIEENMSDSTFGLEQLCRTLGLSRSQLFRKLKALTGKSSSLVIRSVRLQQARKLLKTTNMNVSEIAYSVGFNDLSYFSKCFLDEYGENPSALQSIRKKQRFEKKGKNQ